METMSVQQAARRLHMSDQAVRVRMRRGKLPIGVVYEGNGDKNLVYKIYGAWLDRYLEGNPVSVPEGMSYIEEVAQ